MAFCNKLMSSLRKIMGQIDKVLGETIDEITKYTKLVKDLGLSPEIQALLSIVDKGGKVNPWIEKALEEITGIADNTKTLAEKLKEWLDTATSESDFNKKLLNIASVSTKIADVEAGNEQKAEHVYDTGVQARIIANK